MTKSKAVLIVTSIIILIWIIYSCCKADGYFSAPFHSILTISIGLFVSCYLVQRNTDTRKQYDLIEKILEQTKGKITELLLLLNKNELDMEKLLMLKRAIKNKLVKLKNVNTCESFKANIDECVEEIEDLDRLMEDGMANKGQRVDFINEKRNEIIRISENIENQCDEIIVSLWKI